MKSFIRPALGAMMLALVPLAALAQGAAQPGASTAPQATPAPASAPGAAGAEASGGKGESTKRLAACRADVDQLCPGATKGDRRKCLKDNAAKLSPACTAALADVEAQGKAMRVACREDAARLCAEAKGKGGGGVAQCLRANEAKLSPACATAVKAQSPKG